MAGSRSTEDGSVRRRPQISAEKYMVELSSFLTSPFTPSGMPSPFRPADLHTNCRRPRRRPTLVSAFCIFHSAFLSRHFIHFSPAIRLFRQRVAKLSQVALGLGLGRHKFLRCGSPRNCEPSRAIFAQARRWSAETRRRFRIGARSSRISLALAAASGGRPQSSTQH